MRLLGKNKKRMILDISVYSHGAFIPMKSTDLPGLTITAQGAVEDFPDVVWK